MTDIVFNDKNQQPDDTLLAEKLGPSFSHWKRLRDHVREEYDTREEWKFYGQKYGWQLKTFLKKRNLFFMIPYDSFFKVVFVFGDRAVEEIQKSDVADSLKKEVANAKKYAEGRGLPIDVRDDTHLSDIMKLLEIKINN